MEASNYEISRNTIHFAILFSNTSNISNLLKSALDMSAIYTSVSSNNHYKIHLISNNLNELLFPSVSYSNGNINYEDRLITTLKLTKIREILIERTNEVLLKYSNTTVTSNVINLNSLLKKVLLENNAMKSQEKQILSKAINELSDKKDKSDHKTRIVILSDIKDSDIMNNLVYDNKMAYLIRSNSIHIDCLLLNQSSSTQLELLSYLTIGIYEVISDYLSSTQYFIQNILYGSNELSIKRQLTFENKVEKTEKNGLHKNGISCPNCNHSQEKLYYSTSENTIRCDLTRDCSIIINN